VSRLAGASLLFAILGFAFPLVAGSVAALTLSYRVIFILPYFFIPVWSGAAVVLGYRARMDLEQLGGSESARNRARLGITLGWWGLGYCVAAVLAGFIIFFAWGSQQPCSSTPGVCF
jgi:hypothetical protein